MINIIGLFEPLMNNKGHICIHWEFKQDNSHHLDSVIVELWGVEFDFVSNPGLRTLERAIRNSMTETGVTFKYHEEAYSEA